MCDFVRSQFSLNDLDMMRFVSEACISIYNKKFCLELAECEANKRSDVSRFNDLSVSIKPYTIRHSEHRRSAGKSQDHDERYFAWRYTDLNRQLVR